MKKITSLILALALCAGLCLPAMAADTVTVYLRGEYTNESYDSWVIDECGEDVKEITLKGALRRNGSFAGQYWLESVPVYSADGPVEITIERGERPSIAMMNIGLVAYFAGTDIYVSTMNAVFFDGTVAEVEYDMTGEKLTGKTMSIQEYCEVIDNLENLYYLQGTATATLTEPGKYFVQILHTATVETAADIIEIGDGASSKPAEATESADFADVAADAYYADAVKWAVEQGVTNGSGKNDKGEPIFSPLTVCSRSQVVTFLWRALGKPEPKNAETSFADVTEDWYKTAVAWAVENGVTNGAGTNAKGEEIFDPTRECTGAQIITFIYRALYGLEASQGGAEYYSKAEQWVKDNDLAAGMDFSLTGGCSRADTVTFLYRYDKMKNG